MLACVIITVKIATCFVSYVPFIKFSSINILSCLVCDIIPKANVCLACSLSGGVSLPFEASTVSDVGIIKGKHVAGRC